MKSFISGLRNCHLKGLDSYVIRDRISDSEGMIRVFHNRGNSMHSLLDNGDYMLAPHNHRQDITLYTIFGEAANVMVDIDKRPHRRNKFEFVFGSKILNGAFSLDSVDTAAVDVWQVQNLGRKGIFIPAHAVHTVIAEPDSAWLVIEHELADSKQKSLCYSTRVNFRLSPDGLYDSMTENELEDAHILCRCATGVLESLPAVCLPC